MDSGTVMKLLFSFEINILFETDLVLSFSSSTYRKCYDTKISKKLTNCARNIHVSLLTHPSSVLRF